MKKCIKCGIIYDEKEAWQNPYWCPKCDKERRERITRKFHEIVDKINKAERKEE